jgi:stress-induced morphogen
MATITRGPRDAAAAKLKKSLEKYERQHPGAQATLYRQNSASLRVRIVDKRFRPWSKGRRHDHVWNFLAKHLTNEEMQEISILLLLAPSEQADSFMNWEFDDPVASVTWK